MLGRRREEAWDGSERRAPAAVLVVNENPDACEMLVRMLAHRGFRPTGVTSSDEAGGQMGSLLPRCVVLDIDAGIGTSLKVLDHIRSHPDVRVSAARVVLCGSNPKNRTFSFQSGADSFVLRPYHLDELVAQIDDVLARANEDRARHRRDELARHH
jgi:DNA-binding response OmpR family regulator